MSNLFSHPGGCGLCRRKIMKIVKQLAIFLENQPGALFRVTQDLAKHNININAICVMDSVDHAVVRLIVDKSMEAIHLLGEAGVLVVESDLLEVPLTNAPGELNKLCKQLMDKGINIEYAYGSGEGKLYLRLVSPEKALEALKGSK